MAPCSCRDRDRRRPSCGFGVGDAIARAHDALDDVVDVGEVAAMVPVVEDVDRLAREDALREQEQRHVRPAPRAVHREEAQARDRQREEVAYVCAISSLAFFVAA